MLRKEDDLGFELIFFFFNMRRFGCVVGVFFDLDVVFLW